jgi:hypothetical protein
MIHVQTFSEAGGHAVCEDALEVHRHPSDPDAWLGFLADGQGGQSGGAAAARIACRAAAEAARSLTPEQLADPRAWTTFLQQADAAVTAAPEAGYTTLIGLGIFGDTLYGASSGDSAVLVVSEGEDQIPRQATAHQFKNPPVGSGAATFVPFTARLAGRWAVLAMSDGVWKYAGWDRIVQAVAAHRGESLVAALQAAARLRRSGEFPDDFTIILFESSD